MYRRTGSTGSTGVLSSEGLNVYSGSHGSTSICNDGGLAACSGSWYWGERATEEKRERDRQHPTKKKVRQ